MTKVVGSNPTCEYFCPHGPRKVLDNRIGLVISLSGLIMHFQHLLLNTMW